MKQHLPYAIPILAMLIVALILSGCTAPAPNPPRSRPAGSPPAMVPTSRAAPMPRRSATFPTGLAIHAGSMHGVTPAAGAACWSKMPDLIHAKPVLSSACQNLAGTIP